jgi:phosphoenolpyruvate synthase/pyruvate phosphate dikinase
MKQLSDYFSRLGSKYNMAFSGQEILRDCIMGFDGIQKKLLVLSGIKKGPFREHIIDLNEAISCSVKKYYGRIDANGLRKKQLDQYLEKMVLQFGFRSKREPADILFYTRIYNDISELSVLEQKARKWRELLSKIFPDPLNK